MPRLLRHVICWLLLGLLMSGAPALAQVYEDIILANGLVARLRDPGPFDSLMDRAAKTEQALIEVLSTQDTMKPQVQVKQEAGMWTVYCGPIRVLTVLPKDAQGAGLTHKGLAETWAKNLRERLPMSTPPSRMGAAAPAAPAATPPPTPTPAAPAAPTPPPTAPAAPVAAPLAPAPGAIPLTRSAAVLLLLDSFNTVRGMPEDEYLGRRDRVAGEVLARLANFLASEPTLTLPPSTAAAPAPITAPSMPATPAAPVAVTAPIGPAPVVPAQWRDLPPKERVNNKFGLVEAPYLALRTADPVRFEQVGALLREARQAKAAYKWAEAEGYLDGALALLGVSGL